MQAPKKSWVTRRLAGSIVTEDVPPNTVAAGNPARVISSVQAYIDRIKEISKKQRIFDEEYYIDKLDETRRREIIEAVKEGIGFIV